MDKKILLSLPLFIVALLPSFSFAEDDKAAPSTAIWIDLYQGEPVQYEDMLDDLAKADVIYLGEHHTIDRHHAIQEKILTDLASRGLPLALGLEQMESSQQPHLDRYNRGEIDFEKLAKESDWSKRWANYLQYRPMIEAARKAKIPVIGLNAKAETIHQIARGGGVERLPPEIRKTLPGEMNLQDPVYEKFLSLQMMVHASAKPEMLRPMYEAQMARDESMAQAICDFMKSAEREEAKSHRLLWSGPHRPRLGHSGAGPAANARHSRSDRPLFRERRVEAFARRIGAGSGYRDHARAVAANQIALGRLFVRQTLTVFALVPTLRGCDFIVGSVS